MFPQQLTNLDLVLALAAFGLVFSLWLAAVLFRSLRRFVRAEKIERRLRLDAPASADERELSLWLEDRTATTTVPGYSASRSFLYRLNQLCNDAGWETPASSVLLALAGTSCFSVMVVYFVTGGLLPGFCLAAGIVMAVWFYLKHCIAKRLSVFENQLIDALDLAARSLRAGHPLLGAFQLVSDEIPAPVGRVFLDVCQQQALGLSLEEALAAAARENTNDDLKLFATSVIIQSRSGGNLADMMERLAAVIRERMRLSRRVRVLTAQTQFSKRVLLALPFFIFIILNLINPNYISPLYHSAQGRILLGIGAGLLLTGAWAMNRMAVIRY